MNFFVVESMLQQWHDVANFREFFLKTKFWNTSSVAKGHAGRVLDSDHRILRPSFLKQAGETATWVAGIYE